MHIPFKVNMATEACATAGKQNMANVEDWQSDGCWTIYNEVASIDTRLLTMATRLHVCGAVKLSEKSFATSAAVALSKDGVRDPKDALKLTRLLKYYHSRAAHSVYLQGPETFPLVPADLNTTHPAVWEQINAAGCVVPSSLAPHVVSLLKQLQPCRASKDGCRPCWTDPFKKLKIEGDVPKPLQGLMEQARRQSTFLEDGSECSFNFGPGYRVPIGSPRYSPAEVTRKCIMDEGGEAQGSPPQGPFPVQGFPAQSVPVQGFPAQGPPPQQAAQGPPDASATQLATTTKQTIRDLVGEFHTKAKAMPPPQTKKAAKGKVGRPAKGRVGRPAKAKAAQVPPEAIKSETHGMTAATLAFDLKMKAPRHYGCVTIYTNADKGSWRVKPGKARRDEKKFVFVKDSARAQWRLLVKHVKSLKQST